MDDKFLMGRNDSLDRSFPGNDDATYITSRLRSNLLKSAMMQAFDFYYSFLNQTLPEFDYEGLVNEYEKHYLEALSLGLFRSGGIRGKDHLNFWCLARAFELEVYIESGVFIGSSLHAFMGAPSLERVIAIDPSLNKLRVPSTSIPDAVLIDDKDFSQLEIGGFSSRHLVFFDDHIDTAERILQASRKNLTYLLFDDSTGFEGICQRLYPPVPTIPMIRNWHLLNSGDVLSWTYQNRQNTITGMLKDTLLRKRGRNRTRVSMKIDEELISKCRRASMLIEKCQKIPDLGELIPQRVPEKMVDTSKFLLEIKRTA